MSNPSQSHDDATTTTEHNPFDLAGLRLTQDFTATAGVKRQIVQVPVRRPSAQEFVRVHPSPNYRINATAIQLKEENETYLVTGSLVEALVNETVPLTLHTTINRQGVLSLWPVRLPGLDGKDMEWWRSARDAAEIAMTKWTRFKANKSLGGYDITTAEASVSEPEWPDLSLQRIIEIAFRDRLVDTLDHPVVKRLQGLM
jgi:hypothetical protein